MAHIERLENFATVAHLINEPNWKPLLSLNSNYLLQLYITEDLDLRLIELVANENVQEIRDTLNSILNVILQAITSPIPAVPCRSSMISPQEARNKFSFLNRAAFQIATFEVNQLKGTSIPLTFQDNKYHCVISQPEDYMMFNDLSDYWMEPLRSHAHRLDEPSIAEHWRNNYLSYSGNEAQMREQMYQKIGIEVGNFKPSVATAIYTEFGDRNSRVLDMCGGWGDRLLGAMACNVKSYTCTDPHLPLHSRYAAMQRFFASESVTEVTTVPEKFEDADLPLSYYDIAFTSPPYFDLEVYSEDTSQSIVGRNLKEWIKLWLIPMMIKAVKLLKINGYLIININDYNFKGRKQQICQPMLQAMNKFEHIRYLGVYGQGQYKGSKILAQPIFIWQKY